MLPGGWVESNLILGTAAVEVLKFKLLNGGGSPDFKQPLTAGQNQKQFGV